MKQYCLQTEAAEEDKLVKKAKDIILSPLAWLQAEADGQVPCRSIKHCPLG